MLKMKSKLKRIVSIVLSFTLLMATLQVPVFASVEPVYLPENEMSEEILTSGGFYLATDNAEIQENPEIPYVFKVGRGGDVLPEATVKMNMIDVTAKYGDNYKIKLHNSSAFGSKVKNSFSNSSVLDEILENEDEIVESNYTDMIIATEGMDAEEIENLYNEEIETVDEYLSENLEGYDENKNAYTESNVDEETDETISEEAKSSVNSLKSAKERATGLKSDKTPMDGGNISPANYAEEMLSAMSSNLESAYLMLEFEEGETEKYIEIIPRNNERGDGDVVFSVTLLAASENASITQNSGMNVTIIDDEDQTPATVSFTESTYYPEDGYIKVTIERTGAINQVVSVTVKTEDETAENGRDYSRVDTSVLFPYGITKRTMNIPIRSDYVEDSAKFKIVMSDPLNCTIGEIDTAQGVINENSGSFELMSVDESGNSGSSRAEANTSSYFTGEAFDIANTYSTWVTSNARTNSYTMASGEGVDVYTEASSGGAVSKVIWNLGGRLDISGLEIEWTKESGKPCYTETLVYGDVGNWDEKLWDSPTERWERKTTKVYFPYDKVTEYFIEQKRNAGFFGKSPTLKIHSIKPVLRPFEITLKGADPIKFLNENGEYVDNTTMAEVMDANNALLRNATNTGTGSVVKFSGDSFTITSSSKYSYIKGLKIVNNDTGESKVVRDNLAPGTTSVSIKIENDFLKEYVDYITFSDNGDLGRKAAFSVQPIMEHYDSTVKIHKDYRGEISYNGNPEVKEEADGIVLTYHKGDKIRFTQTKKADYASSYTDSRIRFVTKDNSTATPVDSKRAYDKDTNYCTVLNIYSDMDVYPNFDKKDNHVVVRVLKSDLEKFNTSMGIFTLSGVEAGDYMEYTVVESDNFAAGIYYEFVARAKETGFTPVWQKINSDVKYSQGSFYFESTDEIEENIIYLTCQKADDIFYSLTGDAYYSNVTLNGGKEGSAWMPASGVYILIGADRYGISDENGKFSTAGMYGINGMNVIYKTVASGKTEYKTTTLSNEKLSEFGSNEMVTEAYDVNIGTIKAAASDASSPYVTAVVATTSTNVENGYISIDDQATLFTVAISNNGAKYTDTDGVERVEKVTAVDFLVYDGITHQLKEEFTGARQVSDANGISIWSRTESFKKGESARYAASDELYVRVTTDKVVGNGMGYNSNGELVEIESLKETIHTPVNTGYTFVETNRIDPVTHNFDLDLDTSFIQLPFIGTMQATFNILGFSLGLSELPNGGQRLSLGYVHRFDNNVEKEKVPDDGGIKDEDNPDALGKPYGIGELKKLSEGVSNFGKKLKSNKGAVGVKNWGFGIVVGIYLDFGIKKVQYSDVAGQKLVLIGGGLYFGFTGKFRLTWYLTAFFGLPFYMGIEGDGTVYTNTGITAINEDTATVDRISAEANSFEKELKFSSLVQFNGSVLGYAGLGLCGTLGVRGGLYFYTNLIVNPTIKSVYPDYHILGAIVSLNLRLWVDLLYFPVPSPSFELIGEEFGYFDDIKNSSKQEMDISLMSTEDELNIDMKQRNSKDSKWMPEGDGVSLFSTFEQDTTTVLVENGYDRADSQLLDLGDGRILLVFVADDAERSDEERTAIMYSIYDNGVWSDPVKVQDDGTADFEPDICDGGDKVHITWTSREPGLGYTSPTEFLKTMDVYSTTLDKETLTIGEIERLTDDEFYDSDPKGMYDEVSGDYIVYYLKADVSEDFVKSMSPATNESVIVYMLYDGKEGKWAKDYYYDNEVASKEDADYLVEYWGGQRFLSSPIEDFGMNDPIIIDFDSVSYNNLGVYTFTVDEDNNMDTAEDRELFIQVYDFEEHATYVPIRITNDNIIDARPQLVRSGENTYLFWFRENKDIRYINVSDLVKNGVNDDGTIKDDYELSVGAVFFSPSGTPDINPTFGNYNAFVDKDDNLFVTWLQPVVNEDGSSCQEIYASALVNKGYENSSWSEGVRLTNSGVFHDEVAFVTDSNGDLLTVSNQYSMDLKSESYGVDDVKLVATKFKTVGSLEFAEVEYSNDVPKAGSNVTVTAKVKNTGLKPAKGYTLKVSEVVNGKTGNEVYNIQSENEIAPSASDYVTFEWTMPASYDGIEELSLNMEIQEAETEEIETYLSESIKIKPVYKIVECVAEEHGDEFYATYTVENIGNKDSEARNDKVVMTFNDLYQENVEVEPYLEAPIGDLKINEVKTFVKPLKIDADRFEYGYTNASISVKDEDENLLGDYETLMIVLEHPYDISVNGDKDITEIKLKEGESLSLDVDFSPSDYYMDAKFNFEIKDSSVASVKDGKLVANRVGETDMTIMVAPYGGEKTVKVVVEKKKTSFGGSGVSNVTKYTVEFNTNGGNKIDALKVSKNSTIGKVEIPIKEGFVFDGWYLDKELTKKADLNAKITSNLTLYAKWIEKATSKEWINPFVDVKSDDWFYESVKYANQNGLFSGTAEDTFAPNEDLTRAMLVTVLYRAEGEPEIDAASKFKDVSKGAYYEDAVSWAQKNGIVSGVSKDEFAPDSKITREQIATIMYRYAVYKKLETVDLKENLGFKDTGDISEYAISAMNWITGEEIIKGYADGTVKPKNNATRAEATTMLQRFLEKLNQIEKIKE